MRDEVRGMRRRANGQRPTATRQNPPMAGLGVSARRVDRRLGGA
jgi:hypothetical protein